MRSGAVRRDHLTLKALYSRMCSAAVRRLFALSPPPPYLFTQMRDGGRGHLLEYMREICLMQSFEFPACHFASPFLSRGCVRLIIFLSCLVMTSGWVNISIIFGLQIREVFLMTASDEKEHLRNPG